MVFELVDVRKIIREHYSSLRDDAHLRWIIVLFALIPGLLAGCILYLLNAVLTITSLNALITAFTLFAGLLLNVVVFLFNIAVKGAEALNIGDPKSKTKILLEHVYANSLYAIIVAVLTLLLLLLVSIIGLGTITNLWIIILSGVTYFLTFHFVMTLFMIIERVFTLLTEHLIQIQKQSAN